MYFLARDCFVCNLQKYWIVLCAKRDKYLCISDDDLLSIGDQIDGWNSRNTETARTAPPAVDSQALIESLTANGVLTADSKEGKKFVESEHDRCKSSIHDLCRDLTPSVSFLLLIRFFWACAKSDWCLRRRPFYETLNTVQKRFTGSESESTGSLKRIASLVTVFHALRRFYPRNYLCLFDSLALLMFLRSCQVASHWVFGVVADPFQAHCWVQIGTVLLNDDLEAVLKHKAILSV